MESHPITWLSCADDFEQFYVRGIIYSAENGRIISSRAYHELVYVGDIV